MSICRNCKKEISKYQTMFGYCSECCTKLGDKSMTDSYFCGKCKEYIDKKDWNSYYEICDLCVDKGGSD